MDLEVIGDRHSFATFGDGKRELLIQRQPNGFGSVLGLVDFEANVKILASKEVGPVANSLAQVQLMLCQQYCSLVGWENASCGLISNYCEGLDIWSYQALGKPRDGGSSAQTQRPQAGQLRHQLM